MIAWIRVRALILLTIIPLSIAPPEAHAQSGSSSEMRFTIVGEGTCYGCKVIKAVGRITKETPSRFISFARSNSIAIGPTIFDSSGGHLPIQFNSEGGNLFAALELGRIFRKLRLKVEVPTGNVCLSACVYAIAGGSERSVEGKIAVHQFYSVQMPVQISGTELSIRLSQQQATMGVLTEYLIEMKIDPRLLVLASKVPPGEVQVVTSDQVTDLNLDNTRTRFDGWHLVPYKGGAVVRNDGTTASGDKVWISLYCRKDRGPNALALVARSWNGDDISDLIQTAVVEPHPKVGKSQFGQSTKTKTRHWLSKPGDIVFVEFGIIGNSLTDIALWEHMTIKVFFNPKPLWPYSIEEILPANAASDYFKLASRLCI